MNIVRQKIVKLLLGSSPIHSKEVMKNINETASQGYRIQQITPLLQRSGGAIFTRSHGLFIDEALVCFVREKKNPLYHYWLLRYDEHYAEKQIQQIVNFENSGGFNLSTLIPLNGFLDQTAGQGVGRGTYGLAMFFESQTERNLPLRLDRWILKPNRPVEDDYVSCPVMGCEFKVPCMTRDGPDLDHDQEKLKDYFCPQHMIFISPSTFEYKEPLTSIIWQEKEDLAALNRVKISTGKRGAWRRMGRERDEDSFTWNVFWYLYKENLVLKFLKEIIGRSSFLSANAKSIDEAVFWSVEAGTGNTHQLLIDARKALGENTAHGTEPDVIFTGSVGAEKNVPLVLIECKLSSSPITNKAVIPDYYTNYDKWNRVFNEPPEKVFRVFGYQIVRHLLLANEMAAVGGRNLTPTVLLITKEQVPADIVSQMTSMLMNHPQNARLAFVTWKNVYDFVSSNQGSDKGSINKMILGRYLEGKTLGYDAKGVLHLLLPL